MGYPEDLIKEILSYHNPIEDDGIMIVTDTLSAFQVEGITKFKLHGHKKYEGKLKYKLMQLDPAAAFSIARNSIELDLRQVLYHKLTQAIADIAKTPMKNAAS